MPGRTFFVALLILVSGCQPVAASPSTAPTAPTSTNSAFASTQDPAVVASSPIQPVSTTAGPPTCGEPWRQRVRRPERFTEVAACVTFEGVVRAVKVEPDGDLHVQVLVDPPATQYLNGRNRAAQHGALVLEIEPWEHGARSTAPDPTHVGAHPPAPYCPAACTPIAGDRLRVTSAITTDNEQAHGWNEAHSPSSMQVIGHGPAPHGLVPADPTEGD